MADADGRDSGGFRPSDVREAGGDAADATEAVGDTDSDAHTDGTTDGATDMSEDLTARFAGLWLVDQPSHALYEATLYDFRADGRLVEIDSVVKGPVPTGTVGKCNDDRRADADTICEFGDRWRPVDENRLLVVGDCRDGASRNIVLRFSGFEGADDRPSRVEVQTVDGALGWCHPFFQWAWQRCEDESCLPE